jgi:hypothetical protein
MHNYPCIEGNITFTIGIEEDSLSVTSPPPLTPPLPSSYITFTIGIEVDSLSVTSPPPLTPPLPSSPFQKRRREEQTITIPT